MSKAQRALIPILFIGFITSFSLSTVLPFLVFLVKDFGGNEVVFGFLGAVYAGFEIVGAPLLGNWSDKIGRRKVLMISHFGSFLAWIVFASAFLFESGEEVKTLFGMSIPLIILFSARILDGITGGNIAVANAYLADITPEENNSANFGKMAAASGLGFIIGPALSGVLGDTSLGYLLPVLVAMGITAVGLVFLYFMPDAAAVRSELKLDLEDCKGYIDNQQEKIPLRRALKLPNISRLLLIYFLVFLFFNLFYTSFPLFAESDLLWNSSKIGIYFATLSGLMILVQLFVLPYMSKHYQPVTLVIGGLLILSGYFYLILVENDVTLFVALLFFAAGNGLMWPSYMGLLSRTAGRANQGAIQGYGSSAGALASVIGLALGGVLFLYLGRWTFFITAFGLGLVALLSIPLKSMKENKINKNSKVPN